MGTLYCLIADIPQKVLADIVQIVARQKNIEVLAQRPAISKIQEFLGSNTVDVLIIGMQKNTSHHFCKELITQFPDLLVVGLVDDGRMAVIHMGNIGSSQLVDAIISLGMQKKSDVPAGYAGRN